MEDDTDEDEGHYVICLFAGRRTKNEDDEESAELRRSVTRELVWTSSVERRHSRRLPYRVTPVV